MTAAGARPAHPALGPRLRGIDGRSPTDVFGSPDGGAFRSSVTPFEAVAGDPAPFGAAVGRYDDGDRDGATLRLLPG